MKNVPIAFWIIAALVAGTGTGAAALQHLTAPRASKLNRPSTSNFDVSVRALRFASPAAPKASKPKSSHRNAKRLTARNETR